MTDPTDDTIKDDEATPEETEGDPEEAGATPDNDETGELVDELQRLGREIGRSLKHAWDSEDRQRIEDEVGKSLGAAGREMGKVARQAGDTEAGKQIKAGAETVGRDVRDGLLAGLRLLNRELSKGRSSRDSGDDGDPDPDDEA